MNFIFRWFRKKKFLYVNKILNLEKNLKIREDFIEFYEACVMPSNSPFRRNYFSRSKRYYLNQLIKWRDNAIKYNPHEKILKKVDRPLDEADAISDIFTIIDSIRTFFTYIFPFLSAISVYSKINDIISILLIGFSLILVAIEWYVELLRIDVKVVQKLNEELSISSKDLLLKNGELPEREGLIGPYVWNRSLCNNSTLPNFRFLLMLKARVPSIYSKIKKSLIKVLPKYMPIYVQNPSRINFAIFLIKTEIS